MGTVPIPGLMYNGKQVGYDDGAVEQPPAGGGEPGGTSTPGVGSNCVKYNSVQLGTDENYWLGKKLYDYKQDLASIQGSHQLYFDILVNQYGKRYSDANPPPAGYVKDETMKNWINNMINDAS